MLIEEKQISVFIENLPGLVYLKDLHGRYLAVNSELQRYFSQDKPTEIQFNNPNQILPASLTTLCCEYEQDLTKDSSQVSFEFTLKNFACLDVSLKPFLFDGEFCAILGVIKDVTQEKLVADKNSQYKAVFNSAKEGILLAGVDSKIRAVNPAFTDITGYSADEMIGNNPSMLSSGQHDSSFYSQVYRALYQEGQWHGEVWNKRKNGSLYVQWQTITALKNEKGEIYEFLAVFSDITHKKARLEAIEFRANFDHLTGLPNRAYFHELMANQLTLCCQEKSQCALMYLDLDNFKRINDSLGHSVGDSLLRKVTQVLTNVIGETNTVSRLGGDEFVIMLPSFSQINELERLAQTVVDALKEPFVIESSLVHTGASIGIALSRNVEDVEEILRLADLAMYKAKELGKGRYVFHTGQMSEDVLSARKLELELRESILKQDIRVAFQPIVDLSSHEVLGYEALARWTTSSGQVVAPDVFVSCAEELGLIQDLFEVVYVKVLKGFCDLQKQHAKRIYVSINLSCYQIPSLLGVGWMTEQLSHYDLAPENIILEITEGVLLKDSMNTRLWLEKVREAGYRLALDDFGTGFSSLAYLKSIPVDILKIDRRFVADIANDESDLALVSAILAIAEAFSIRVIAEGVERESQRQVLGRLGCGLAQGYYFGRPAEVEKKALLV
ncbi:bifunctional diguanylate cyclase/phosphodiesterase [Marinomonas sp. S3726]|uniref:sensor domain-containing protein n=1 Tax=Marinomonas sp. S3726 TaxID=579484 RepID=UPI000695E677|nr:bifunctional diguanylate cyclase/phosphodiesterase [Marinomonas sp. S3726]